MERIRAEILDLLLRGFFFKFLAHITPSGDYTGGPLAESLPDQRFGNGVSANDLLRIDAGIVAPPTGRLYSRALSFRTRALCRTG